MPETVRLADLHTGLSASTVLASSSRLRLAIVANSSASCASLRSSARAGAGARLGVAWRETGLWLDEERPWLGASPDRVSADGSQLLECKSVARLPAAGPSAAQLVQVQLQMLVTGVHRAVLALEEAGSGRLALHRVRFDAELAREQLVPPLQCIYAAAAHAIAEGAAEEAFPPALGPDESQRLKAALAESRALFVRPDGGPTASLNIKERLTPTHR